MALWSAENATNAYLRTIQGSKSGKEPNGAEFISALAAGNNAQFTVVACAAAADSTVVALAAAALQTGGRIVCILRGEEERIRSSRAAPGTNIEFVSGYANELLTERYTEADFVAIDCNLENHEVIISGLQQKTNPTIVLGYNAFCKESWKKSPLRTQLLPIGEGLLVTRITAVKKRSKSNWVVTVDKCTGEEHVFRVRSSEGRNVIRA